MCSDTTRDIIYYIQRSVQHDVSHNLQAISFFLFRVSLRIHVLSHCDSNLVQFARIRIQLLVGGRVWPLGYQLAASAMEDTKRTIKLRNQGILYDPFNKFQCL